MKIKPYKDFIRKEEQPLCPNCNISMEFDSNITKKETFFRKGHEDAIFECEGCRQYFLVEDYTDKKNKKNENGE